MAIIKRTVEGLKVETWDFKPNVGKFVVFKNKVWRMVGKWGFYKDEITYHLERPNEESIYVKGPELLEVKEIIKPHGHISIENLQETILKHI